MMAYPMGLPAWDPVALCINGEDGLDGTQVCGGMFPLCVFLVPTPLRRFVIEYRARLFAVRRRYHSHFYCLTGVCLRIYC